MAMEWEFDKDKTNGYACSALASDFLILGYYIGNNTEFLTVWVESGENYAADNTAVADFGNSISRLANTKILSTEIADNDVIYVLAKDVSSTKPLYKIMLLGVILSSGFPKIVSLGTKRMPDSTYDSEAMQNFEKYPPTRLFLYFRNDDKESLRPGVLLMSHLQISNEENIGLLIYAFGIVNKDEYYSYSYNPFVYLDDNNLKQLRIISDGSTTNKYLGCSTLRNQFSCGTTCSSRYYPSNSRCARCHFSCNTCTGPLPSQCVDCVSAASFNAPLGQCLCSGAFLNGACSYSVSNVRPTFKYGASRVACPPYALDLLNDFKDIFRKSVSTTTETDLYRMTSCVSVPGLADLSNLPEEFTVSVWLQATVSPGDMVLWAFNNLELRVPSSPSTLNSDSDFIEIRLGSSSVVSYKIAMEWTNPLQWKFISISIKQNLLGYTISVYSYMYCAKPSCDSLSSSSSVAKFTKSVNTPISLQKYINEIYVGCSSYNNNKYISGFIRDLSFIAKYITTDEMSMLKSLVYTRNLQANSFLSYWHFYPLVANAFLQDSSDPPLSSNFRVFSINIYRDNGLITNGLKDARQYDSSLGIVGTCFDLFGFSKFPTFSFDTLNFAGNELQPKINLNSIIVLSGLIQKGDTIVFTYGKCGDDMQPLAKARVLFNGTVTLKQVKRIPMTVRGTYVDTCYCNTKCSWLGRTYFPLLPTQMDPAHGMSDSTTGPVMFRLRGGDQSYGDKLTLVNMVKDVIVTTRETLIVDEKDAGYQFYSVVRKPTGEYESLVTIDLDRATYTIGWRPSYMPYLLNERSAIYKNLYISWALQAAPKVRFAPIPGLSNSFKNTVEFKNEFFYIDLVGPGQADGDQLIFCMYSCNYPHMPGYGETITRPFQRENNRYPPIWFGEETGVTRIKTKSPNSQRLYICWRPAARSSYIAPEDDEWETLDDLQNPGVRAYITVKYVDQYASNSEILQLSLPVQKTYARGIVTAPVLFQGDTLWFKMSGDHVINSNCALPMNGGKIEIAHVSYDSYEKNSYTLEAVWSETTVAANSLGSYSSKKMKSDSNCNYTLEEIPYSMMKPGHDYMLIIYSNTFAKLGSPSAIGPQPLFKYLFKYQESVFDDLAINKLIQSDTQIIVKGTNFGNMLIAGNRHDEERKLFGIIVNVTASPPCKNGKVMAGYISGSIEDSPSVIKLEDLDLSSCSSGTELRVDLKLLKIADDYNELPLWSTTNTSSSILVAIVACDPSCATCSGINNTECLTCPKAYHLYKGRCLPKCESDMSYSNVVFDGSENIDYYECTSECGPGYYLNEGLGFCLKCNYECATCSSGRPMSCTSCKGTYSPSSNINQHYMNVYQEAMSFRGMCLLECPIIKNVLDNDNNVIKINSYEHACEVSAITPNYINVTIQPVIYSERVNIMKQIYLRALLEDKRESVVNPIIPNYKWDAHPIEELTEKFLSFDNRTFKNYNVDNIKSSIAAINMNAFNYKGDNDQMRIVVRAWDDKAFDFDIIELYGNKPPEIDKEKISFINPIDSSIITNSTVIETMTYINIRLEGVEDLDDDFPRLKYKVILIPKSLVLPDPLPRTSVPVFALSLLAQLPKQPRVVFSSKRASPDNNNVVTLENIYIPPLIEGLQVISQREKINSSKLDCDIYIYIEDRHIGVINKKFSFKVQESYNPKDKTGTSSMTNVIKNLLTEMKTKQHKRKLSLDDVLKMAHTLRIANLDLGLYYMNYQKCTKDDDCKNGAECMTSGGWSRCVCKYNFTGVQCDWDSEDFAVQGNIVDIMMDYLNDTFLSPARTASSFSINDTSLVDELANILIGLTRNPEPIKKKHLTAISEIAWFMTRIDYITGGRLEDFERANVLAALDGVIKLVYYQLREDIYKFYNLGEFKNTFSQAQKAEYIVQRRYLTTIVQNIRNALYGFTDAISITLYPTAEPYSVKYDTFEILFTSVTENGLFQFLDDRLGVKLTSEKEYIRIPGTLLKTLRKEISYNEEFRLKIVKWNENPYVFSQYNGEVCSPVYNISLLNANSSMITTPLGEPIVIFMPTSNYLKNLPTDEVHCMYYNDTHMGNLTVQVKRKVNVNQLNLTDEEKTALYPEWKAELYHSKNLIVEETSYIDKWSLYPEFFNVNGSNTYGNVLHATDYESMFSCVVYTHSEIAAIAQRKFSVKRDSQVIPFYYDYDPFDSYSTSVGLYVLIVVGSMFFISLIISWIADHILLPIHEEELLTRRPEKVKEDTTINSMVTNNRLISASSINEEFGYRKEETKFESTKEGKQKLNKRLIQRGRSNIQNDKRKHMDYHKASLDDKSGSMHISTLDIYQTNTKAELREVTNNTTTLNNMTGSTINMTNAATNKITLVEKNTGETIQDFETFPKRIKNVFDKEHTLRREIEEFGILSIIAYSDLVTNIIICTNNLFTRPMRCIVLYCYIYFLMFWAAVLIICTNKSLDHPEHDKSVMALLHHNTWIMFVCPIIASVNLYLISGLFKVDQSYMQNVKTVTKYHQVMMEYYQKTMVRRVFGIVLSAICVIAANIYLYRFSIMFGYSFM